MFTPNLSILPEPQRLLWRELRDTPKEFVLYGGTALALRLGHRQSEDFDFFSNRPFLPNSLRDRIPYLKHAEMTQFQDNTLTAIVGNGPVKLSFFGSLGMKRVHDPDTAEENGIKIASLLDLLASKLKTIQSRAEAKDYRDIVALFDAGLNLAEGLAAAVAIYGRDFNGALSLKALTFFEDGDLPGLTSVVQKRLREAATSVRLKGLPLVAARPGLSREEGE
jgi:hypothetical protein